MEQEILSKRDELAKLHTDNGELRKWVEDSNLWSWVYSAFRVNGQRVSKPAVVDMLKGTIREDAPLSCYGYVQNYKHMYLDMKRELSMQSTPDLKLFMRWTEQLTGACEFRKRNGAVYELSLIPCHFNEIKENLSAAFKAYVTTSAGPVQAASDLFLQIVRIYPFDEDTLDMAMAVLMYCLMAAGLPLPELPIDEEECLKLLAAYMDHGDSEPFMNMLERSLYNRLDAIILVTKQSIENDY